MEYFYNNELIINSVSDEAVIILHPESLNLYEINSSGMAVFVLLDGKLSGDEIIEQIRRKSNELDVDFDKEKLDAFLNKLLSEELICSLGNDFGNKIRVIIPEIERNWIFNEFCPLVELISDMTEGFFSKVHVE